MICSPSIDEFRQSGRLSPAGGEAALVYEDQHQVAFVSEVDDVLGHERAILFACSGRDIWVFGCPESDLGDVNGVVTVAVSE